MPSRRSRSRSGRRSVAALLPQGPNWYPAPPAFLRNMEYPPEYQLTQHRPRRRSPEGDSDKPHTVDIIGNGPETTICGHIDLLRLLPLHHDMHRELLETFKRKPGNYEGKYNNKSESKASTLNYGNGYLAIHFTDDITRPEMSDFLIKHGWKMISGHCTTQDGRPIIYEKWTNVRSKMPGSPRGNQSRIMPPMMGQYY